MAGSDDVRDRNAAQQRADRIHAFQAEVAQLQQEGLLTLSPEQQQRVTTHHAQILRGLGKQFDVDTTAGQKQMSVGMRIVSFLGALALAASVIFFFYRIWGLISTPTQVLILMAGPVLALFGMELTRTRERQPYMTSLLGLVAFAAFVLNLAVLGSIFNITPSPNACLAWGAFAMSLAYRYELRLLLVASMLALLAYLSACIGTWRGWYWLSFGERPEHFIVAGAVLALVPAMLRHPKHHDFLGYYRFTGILTVLVAVLTMSHWGNGSYLVWSPTTIEHTYQLVGFLLAAGTIWIGVWKRWSIITNLGVTFFTIDLYTKFYDWWWGWMPKYLFFFCLGLVALLLLMVFNRLRRQLVQEAVA